MKNIVVVVHYSGLICRLPPLISLLSVLKDIGVRCVFLGLEHCSKNRACCAEIGIEYRSVRYKERSISFYRHPLERICYEAGKYKKFRLFRRQLWDVVESCRCANNELIVWTIGSMAAANFGDRLRSLGRRHVQSFYELEEEFGRGTEGFDLDAVYQNATIVECEPNRAEILAATHDMPYVPFVIPNCPYSHPRNRHLPIDDATARSLVAKWEGKFVFLYQGVLTPDRMGIRDVLEALCKNFPNDIVAIMTWLDEIDLGTLRQYENFQQVPYLSAPYHLQVTSHASVGLAYYSRGSMSGYSKLNSLYCAPNKIYEYAGFGIPILCNDVPGLKYTVGACGAGACWNQCEGVDGVVLKAKRIKADYQKFSQASCLLYDSVDLRSRVKNIISFACGGNGASV